MGSPDIGAIGEWLGHKGLFLAQAEFKEVPYTPEGLEEEALDQAVGGEEQESEIPEAKAEPGPAEHEGGPAVPREHS